jgi:hypothetical protein
MRSADTIPVNLEHVARLLLSGGRFPTVALSTQLSRSLTTRHAGPHRAVQIFGSEGIPTADDKAFVQEARS